MRCSRKWAMPDCPSGSSAEPLRYHTMWVTTGTRRSGMTTTSRPLSRAKDDTSGPLPSVRPNGAASVRGLVATLLSDIDPRLTDVESVAVAGSTGTATVSWLDMSEILPADAPGPTRSLASLLTKENLRIGLVHPFGDPEGTLDRLAGSGAAIGGRRVGKAAPRRLGAVGDLRRAPLSV